MKFATAMIEVRESVRVLSYAQLSGFFMKTVEILYRDGDNYVPEFGNSPAGWEKVAVDEIVQELKYLVKFPAETRPVEFLVLNNDQTWVTVTLEVPRDLRCHEDMVKWAVSSGFLTTSRFPRAVMFSVYSGPNT